MATTFARERYSSETRCGEIARHGRRTGRNPVRTETHGTAARGEDERGSHDERHSSDGDGKRRANRRTRGPTDGGNDTGCLREGVAERERAGPGRRRVTATAVGGGGAKLIRHATATVVRHGYKCASDARSVKIQLGEMCDLRDWYDKIEKRNIFAPKTRKKNTEKMTTF